MLKPTPAVPTVKELQEFMRSRFPNLSDQLEHVPFVTSSSEDGHREGKWFRIILPDARNTSAGDGGVLAPTPMGPRPEPSTPLYVTQESEAPSRDEALASCRLPPQAGHHPMCRPPTCSCTEQTAVPTMGTDPHGTSAAKSAASPSTSRLVRRRSSSSSSSSSRSTPAAARLKKTKTLEDSRTPEDNQLLAIQDSSTLEVELPVIGDFSKASASRCQQVFSSHCH